MDQLYNGVPCEGTCDLASGAPVFVSAGNTAVADFVLAAGGAIAGTITGPGGVPVANLEVLVRAEFGQQITSAVTDANGGYETAHILPAGNYNVITHYSNALIDEAYPDQPCPGSNCEPAGSLVAVTAGNVTAGIDFELAPGARISGEVTRADDGTPLQAAIFVFNSSNPSPIIVATTDPNGAWQSPALPPGDWKVLTGRQSPLLGEVWPGIPCDIICEPAPGAAVTITGTTAVTDIDFALDLGAQLSGTVTAAEGGAPVENAMIIVNDAQRGPIAFSSSLPDGSYTTEAFLPGTVTLLAQAPDFLLAAFGESCEPDCQPGSGSQIAAAAGLQAGFNFALQSGGGLEGTITGPNGPIEGATVVVLKPDGTVASVVFTDSAGHYDTGSTLGGGQYRLHTFNQAGAIDEAWPDTPCIASTCAADVGDLAAVTLGQSTVANFTLAAGARIAGQVRRASDNAPISMPMLRLTNASGLQFFFSGDVDGTYDTGTGLPPGDYHLVASSPLVDLLAEAWEEHPCSNCPDTAGDPIPVVGPGLVGGIDFTLNAGATISGEVLDDDTGLPVANASVFVFDAEGTDIIASGVSAGDGSYTTQAFMPAEVYVIASAAGYLDAIPGDTPCPSACFPEAGPLLQVPFAGLADVDFSLLRGSRIAGRVLEPDGTPVEGANVQAVSDDYAMAATTGADGSYLIEDLPNGGFIVYAESVGDYVATAWPSEQCVTGCNPATRDTLTLGGGDDFTGIDITLVEGGRLRGRVEGMPGNIAQPGAVEFYEAGTVEFAGSVGLVGGEYVSDPLPAGEYLVFTATSGGYIDELYDDVPCPFSCDETPATPVPVTIGEESTVDFELTQGGRIAGRIFDAGTNGVLPQRPSVQVRMGDNAVVWSGTVASNGTYLTRALPAGTYYVRSRNRSGFLDEMYLDEECYWCAPVGGIDINGQPVTPTPVNIVVGVTTPGIDLGLSPGRRLGGRVTVAPGGQGLPSIVVSVYDANGRFMSSGTSNSQGEWNAFNGYAPGTYYLRAASDGRYFDELYGGVPCNGACDVTQGTPVVVVAEDHTDLDFALSVQPVVFGDGFE